MKFSVGCVLGYRIQDASTLIFNIEAAKTGQQLVTSERLTIEPDVAVEHYLVPESSNRYFRVKAEPGELTVRYDADIELTVWDDDPASVSEVNPADLPFSVLPHLFPSRYCPADQLCRLARREFARMPPGHQRVTAICNWIYGQIDYLRGSSDSQTSAYDTIVERAGVCRDFAHLGISLCRALNIPARFVSGYALGLEPADFHAVFEAYLGGRWYLFDPTRQAALDGIVRIGVGRDASEVSFATIYGDVEPMDMEVYIRTDSGPEREAPRTVSAVSISEI
jgi:transglutaminase-like putative cysteine protease